MRGAKASPWQQHERGAVQSFIEDVLAIAAELGLAGDVATFAASLYELVELASEHVVLADDDSDGALVVRIGASRFRVEIEPR